MKKSIKTLLITLLTISTLTTTAQSRKDFIRKYKHIAIQEMERTGIPASIKLAQGILESGCGASELCANANNHFGIKCHDWVGPTYRMDDDSPDECFRKYKNPEQSWIDHSTFLTSRPRYAGLFDIPTTDYKAWARGLKAAGYATNPKYADLLIKIIEEEELYQYDHIVKHPTLENAPEFAENRPVKEPDTDTDLNYLQREEIRNGIVCIEIKEGDTFESIANYYGLKLNKLLAYNDKKDLSLTSGQYVYLKKKKSKAAKGYDFHRVKEGDNLYMISQMYGVRLKSLVNYNYLNSNDKLIEGDKIYLRSKAGV